MRLQHGFTLTEVLVALLVLTIGLLGVLATQTLALKQVRDAIHRTKALALSHSLMQEIQANQALAVVLGSHINLQSEIPSASSCTPAQPCNPGELAALQLQQWFALLKPEHGMVLPEAEFCFQPGSAGIGLSVSWQNTQRAAGQAVMCQPAAGRNHFSLNAG